ncbi:bifunctional nuclease family protein [Flammeovirgaceae bacterium SG7u.111]|nr:bifunctional nuclease family protein [Flammeovirgaceae bacterium SG7u.132]WPO36888.1 bifunctional nuclease family protein [Flammeovirgaceae bacterium SG7u.111]
MDKIKLEILGLSASHSQSGSFALVLGEEHGSRRLPIIIGMFEAQAIAIEMEKIVSNRPMTHDLFRSFSDKFEIDIHEIIISDLREGVFYAKIISSSKDGTNFVEIDARPSDAVAIALRFNAPIFTVESVLQEAGIVLNDEEEEQAPKPSRKKTSAEPMETVSSTPPSSLGDDLASIPTSSLQSMMEAAIANEEYEKAAKIRDEINKRQE